MVPRTKSGLKIQDILLSLDGRSMGSVPLAEMIISTRPAESTVKAEVLRGSKILALTIPVAEQKNDVDQLGDLVDPKKISSRSSEFSAWKSTATSPLNSKICANPPASSSPPWRKTMPARSRSAGRRRDSRIKRKENRNGRGLREALKADCRRRSRRDSNRT